MSEERNPDREEPTAVPSLSEHQQTRRRLLRGGAAAAPVVLTVVSHPVMAGTGSCTAASAFTSINSSRAGGNVTVCNGKPPEWWAHPNNSSFWPSKYPQSKKFDSCLNSYSPCNNKTLLQVLQITDASGNTGVAKHIVAALLNAATGRTPGVLDENKVKTIWSQFLSGPYRYSPTPGVSWYADYSVPAAPKPYRGGITEWLRSTMV